VKGPPYRGKLASRFGCSGIPYFGFRASRGFWVTFETSPIPGGANA